MRLAFAAAALLALLALLAQAPAAAATVCPRKGKIAAAGQCSTKYHVCPRKGARPTTTRTCAKGKFFNAASSSCEVRPACATQQPGGTMLGGTAYDSGYQNGTWPYPGPSNWGPLGSYWAGQGHTYCCYNKNTYQNTRRFVNEKTCTMNPSSQAQERVFFAFYKEYPNPTQDKDYIWRLYGDKYFWPEMKSCCESWYLSDRIIAPCCYSGTDLNYKTPC